MANPCHDHYALAFRASIASLVNYKRASSVGLTYFFFNFGKQFSHPVIGRKLLESLFSSCSVVAAVAAAAAVVVVVGGGTVAVVVVKKKKTVIYFSFGGSH